MKTTRLFGHWISGSVRIITRGGALYWAWVIFLLALFGIGLASYVTQLQDGLITTNMRDQVSWGFYIGNFTFLVGVAAAAVTLVVPAYLYGWKPIKEIVVYGEMMAITAITCCALFVVVDIGHPERFWHLIPGPGILNVPTSLLGWDVIALNGYLLLNLTIVTYLLFNLFRRRHPNKYIYMTLVWISIPAAIAIHTVTAFLYSGLIARPFWNSAILAPRFIVSAFCSGPALMLIIMQVMQRFTSFHIRREAIWKIAELMTYFMGFNLFLLGAEVFKDYYSDTEHLVYMRYMFNGVDGHNAIVPYMWAAVACSAIAFTMFLSRRRRQNMIIMNIGCVLVFVGVYLEKSMGMVIPGMTPDPLGEIYEYVPAWHEVRVSLGILAFGALLYTWMVKVATPILHDEFHFDDGKATHPTSPREREG